MSARGPTAEGRADGRAAGRPHDPRITVIQKELFDERKSKVDKYRDLVIGRSGAGALIGFELVMLLSSWVQLPHVHFYLSG